MGSRNIRPLTITICFFPIEACGILQPNASSAQRGLDETNEIAFFLVVSL